MSYLKVKQNPIHPQSKHNASSNIQVFMYAHSCLYRILQGLNRFVDLVPVDNQTGNVTFTLNNFGLIALDTNLLNQTTVQAFSANLGPVTVAVSSREIISANQLLVTADPISNATGSIEIQDLTSCPLLNSSQRIAYSVFHTDALFLTPETGCTNFTVGSIILGVRANISQGCNITSVIVDLEQLQEVSFDVEVTEIVELYLIQVCSGMQLSKNQPPICFNYDEEEISMTHFIQLCISHSNLNHSCRWSWQMVSGQL